MPDDSDRAGPEERERVVAAYFHRMRSASKRKPDPGVEKIVAALVKRMREKG